MQPTPTQTAIDALTLTEAEIDELETILQDLSQRDENIPQWEFCDGFLTAIACGRRAIAAEEWMMYLVGNGEVAEDLKEGHHPPCMPPFANAEQQERFALLCQRRIQEVQLQLDMGPDDAGEDYLFDPMAADIRGHIAQLPEDERAALERDNQGMPLPSFGQVWSFGFDFATECWPDDWALPRDKKMARWMQAAIKAITQLNKDDDGTPYMTLIEAQEGQPEPALTISRERIEAYTEAVEAVYELREIAKSLGPRIEQVWREATPGRNDPCPCGSGKKYKKCHGG